MKILNLLLIFTFFYGFGQNQNTDPVKDISEDACQCISQINTDNSTKNKAIKNCIASSIVKNLKTEVNNDKDHTTEIQIESKAYNQIESYLVENCAALKQLSFAENKKLRWMLIYSGFAYVMFQSIFWFYQPYFKLTGVELIYFGFIFAIFQNLL